MPKLPDLQDKISICRESFKSYSQIIQQPFHYRLACNKINRLWSLFMTCYEIVIAGRVLTYVFYCCPAWPNNKTFQFLLTQYFHFHVIQMFQEFTLFCGPARNSKESWMKLSCPALCQGLNVIIEIRIKPLLYCTDNMWRLWDTEKLNLIFFQMVDNLPWNLCLSHDITWQLYNNQVIGSKLSLTFISIFKRDPGRFHEAIRESWRTCSRRCIPVENIDSFHCCIIKMDRW